MNRLCFEMTTLVLCMNKLCFGLDLLGGVRHGCEACCTGVML